MAALKLRRIWDNFLKVPSEQTQKYSRYLNRFLGLYLHEARQTENEKLHFSDMQSVCNVLTRAFMEDVQKAIPSDEDEDCTDLAKYLLKERGWMILEVLQHIGIKNAIASFSELANMLILLLPACSKFSVSAGVENTDTYFPLPTIEDCFHHTSSPGSPFHYHEPRQLYSTTPKVRRTSRASSSSQGHQGDSSGSEHKAEDGSPDLSRKYKKRTSALTQMSFRTLAKEFDFLSGYVTTREKSGSVSPPSENVDVGKQGLSVLELSVLILNLLQDICQCEGSRVGQNKSISVTILPVLIQVLTEFHGDVNGDDPKSPLKEWKKDDIIIFQQYLVRVILALSSVVTRQNGVNVITESGAIPALIDIVKEIFISMSKVSPSAMTAEFKTCDHSEETLAQDMVQGLLLLIHTSFENLPCNLTYLNSALLLFHEFHDAKGFDLVETVMVKAEQKITDEKTEKKIVDRSKEFVRQILHSVNKVTDSMKKAKLEYLHAMKCLKKKHRTCLGYYSKYLHHHHDSLGVACCNYDDQILMSSDSYGSLGSIDCGPDGNQTKCTVAVTTLFLLKLIHTLESKHSQMNILAFIDSSGICCCVPPEKIIESFMSGINKKPASLRGKILSVTIKLLLDQCGGAEVVDTEEDLCKFCREEVLTKPLFSSELSEQEENKGIFVDASDSALSSSASSLQDDRKTVPRWRVVKQFYELVKGDNQALAVQVTKHLLRLVCLSNASVKYQLFTCIFLPILQAKKRSSMEHETTSQTVKAPSDKVIQYCLQALPCLLQSRSSQDLFFSRGGIKQLTDLLVNENLRGSIMKVFEVLASENNQESASAEESVLEESTRTMVSSASESPWKGGDNSLLSEKSGMTAVEAFLSIALKNERTRTIAEGRSKFYVDTDVGTTPTETLLLHDYPDEQKIPLDEIPFLADVWKTAERLFTGSSNFQLHFIEHSGPNYAYDLLGAVVQSLDVEQNETDQSTPTNVFEALGGGKRVSTIRLMFPCVDDQQTVLKHKLALFEALFKICLGCCEKEGLKQKWKKVENLTSELGTLLRAYFPRNVPDVKAVFDGTLNCAVKSTVTSELPSSYTLVHLKEDEALEEDDVLELSDVGSSKDSEAVLTEQGYDADSECTTDDLRKAGRRSLSKSQPSSSSGDPKNTIVYPQVCGMTLSLLAHHLNTDPGLGAGHEMLIYVIQRVLALAKESSENVKKMYSQNMLSIVLSGFKNVLTTSSDDYKVAQEFLLDLCLHLANHALSSAELKLYLQMFKEENPPLDALLSTLIQLTENIEVHPTYILCFPVLKPKPDLEKTVHLPAGMPRSLTGTISRTPDRASPSNIRTSATDSLKRSKSMPGGKQNHGDELELTVLPKPALPRSISSPPDAKPPENKAAEQNPYSCGAMQFPLRDGMNWKDGVSISIWLRVDNGTAEVTPYNRSKKARRRKSVMFRESSEENLDVDISRGSGRMKIVKKMVTQRYLTSNCLHVLSMACKDACFEMWVDPTNGNVIFRITQHKEVLREGCMTGLFTNSRWQHLTMTYKEIVESATKMAGVISICNDGSNHIEERMEFMAEHKRTKAPSLTKLYLGHCKSIEDTTNPWSWFMGNLMMFKGCVLNQELSFHLFSLGPNCCSVSQCDTVDPDFVYYHHISQSLILSLGVSTEVLTGNKSIDLQPLRENFFLSFQPQMPSNVCVSAINGRESGPLAKLPFFGDQKSDATRYLRQQPITDKTIFNPSELKAIIIPQIHKGIELAIMEIGGVAVFLFLFARIVDLSDNEQHQASALKLLLSLTQHKRHAQDFQEMSGYAMLANVLVTGKCKVGFPALKVLLDAFTSESVIQFNQSSKQYTLLGDTSALIQDTAILTNVLLAWRVWDKQDMEVWHMCFSALEMMIREDHPHRDFNLQQLQCARVVDRLLLIGQERLHDTCPSLPTSICNSMVKLIEAMLGSPPDINLVVTISDFLLIVHPAASTYVSHNPEGFYFADHWVPSEKKKRFNITSRAAPPEPPASSTPIAMEKLGQEEGNQSGGKGDVRIRSSSSPPSIATSARQLEYGENIENAIPDGDIVKRRSKTFPLSHEDQEFVELGLDVSQWDENSNKEDFADDIPNDATETRSKSLVNEEAVKLSEHDNQDDNSIQKNKDSDVLSVSIDPPTPSGEETDSMFKSDMTSGMSVYPQSSASDLLASASGTLNSSFENLGDTPGSSLSEDWEMFIDPTSMKSVPVSLDNDDGNDIVDEGETGLVYICTGLLKLLHTVVINTGDASSKKTILGLVLKPEVLVVLAHHNAVEIRTKVVELLDVYFHRASDEQCESFLKIQGFHLLASQLHQHQASRELVEACLTLLFGKPHALTEDCDPHLLTEITSLKQQSVVLVMALAEKTVHDDVLCHNTLCLLIQLFETVPNLAVKMIENHVVSMLCNVMAAVNLKDARETESSGLNGHEVLVGDIQHFARLIAVKTFSTPGTASYQDFEDMMMMFKLLEQKEKEKYGLESEAVKRVRNLQCSTLQGVLEFVETTANKEDKIVPRDGAKPEIRVIRRVSSHAGVGAKPSLSYYGQPLRLLENRLSTYTIAEESSGDEDQKEAGDMGGSTDDRRASVQLDNESDQAQLLLSLDPARRHSSQANIDGGLLNTTAKKSKDWSGKLSVNELIDRFKKVLTMAVNLTLYSEKIPVTPTVLEEKLSTLVDDNFTFVYEKQFHRDLLEFTLKAFAESLDRNRGTKKDWNTLLWQCKDMLRPLFTKLFTQMLSPSEDLDQRLFALQKTLHHPKSKDVLKLALNLNVNQGHKVAYYLFELLSNNKLDLAYQDLGEKMEALLKQSDITPIKTLSEEQRACVEQDKLTWARDIAEGMDRLARGRDNMQQRLLHKADQLSKQISVHAMEVTQSVVNTQSLERNKFIEHVKMAMSSDLQIKKAWQHLIKQLTHERAVWFCPESFPTSWQLDQTEGPHRVRRRMRRCHLGLKEKYVKEGHRNKLEAEYHPPPLSYLFEADDAVSDSAKMIYRLHTNEKVSHTCHCTSVTPSSEVAGEVLVGETNVYFVGDAAIKDSNSTQILLGNRDLLSMTWPHEEIKEIHKRRFQLQDNALEIFLANGKTCLLAFDSTKDRDQAYRHLDSLELPNRIKGEDVDIVQTLWIEGRITNFEYLAHLNKISGRSFNDLMQYPIFPFIISNYKHSTLDLEDERQFRKLDTPISIQNKEREDKYITNYEILKSEYDKSAHDPDPTGFVVEPYHYGSLYSNSGTVLHFLVRLTPFTRMHLSYQDQNFDIPDRLFHSMETSWRLASFESTTDFKELIPEFFFLPEFLENGENLELGVRQGGERVENVTLPRWCHNDPRLFILIHRQALESVFVSNHIHNWIDLIFGYKQTGKPALDAINVFHPVCYFGVDIDTIQDPLGRNAKKTMIRTYGQVPKQLFRSGPHPSCQLPTEHSTTKLISSLLLLPKDQAQEEEEKKKTMKKKMVVSPLDGVSGLKWGNYVGSPECPPPVLQWTQGHGSPVASLVALPTGEVFGLGKNCCLLIKYSKEKGVTTINTTDVIWAGIVSWGHPDSIIRIQNKKSQPNVNFLNWSTEEQVTCCASVPDCKLLFIGGTAGVITIYNTKFNTTKQCDIQVLGHKTSLYGHADSITCLQVCKPYSILVSGSADKTCIIWDLNRLEYVRSIDSHTNPITTIAISDTLGDIATASNTDEGSCLQLHTINTKFVAEYRCKELIFCLTYSTAPEGRSVNVLAGGLDYGKIRLWSSWDLQHVCDINDPKSGTAIISLTFTNDNQRLFSSNTDGVVSVWGKPSNQKVKPPNFIPFI